MNALTKSVLRFALECQGAKSVPFYELGRIDPGFEANPCATCEGAGACECGSSTNDPDAATYRDECPVCDGTGCAPCQQCGERVSTLVLGTGRCLECVTQAAMEGCLQEESDSTLSGIPLEPFVRGGF